MMRRGAVLLAVCSGCSDGPPAYPEALIVADTDLPVPSVVGRLRVDLYDEGGRWFESRDIARPDPRDWPVSFSVFSQDESRTVPVWVRLRAYHEAAVRAYRGERFMDWGDALLEPNGNDQPRLIDGTTDVTPEAEPQPLVAVDRLLYVPLEPGVRGRVEVNLAGACGGTMARLAVTPDAGPKLGEAASCVDVFATRELVTASAVVGNLDLPVISTRVGSYRAQACPEQTDSSRVCIPGGATILGSSETQLLPDLAAVPERTVSHRGFLIDRYEVSVARFRQALTEGFEPSSLPTVNDAELGNTVQTSCSYSSAPRGREAFAVSCVEYYVAREFCAFYGGSLPTEAEWEYVATRSSERGRSRFPWGDAPVTCERAVYGRLSLSGAPGACEALGSGPLPIMADDPNDRTADGVVGMAGGVSEWCRDDYQDYTSPCWGRSPNHDPECIEAGSLRSVRGGAWASPPPVLRSAARLGAPPIQRGSFLGFRCVYPLEAP